MSGAVSSISKVGNAVWQGAKTAYDYNPYLIVGRTVSAMSHGDSLGQSLGSGIAPAVDNTKNLVSGIMGSSAAPPNIATPDPAAIAAASKQAQIAAMRQAQIDAQSNSPSRGGTVLTDNYSYRV